MELKAVGNLGMVKRKQFLQKRDISRSHEVSSLVLFFLISFIHKENKIIRTNERLFLFEFLVGKMRYKEKKKA